MRVNEVKNILTDLVQDFFYAATVVWSNEVSEKPTLPLITLRTGTVKKAKYPKHTDRNENGYFEEYDAVLRLEVKGYTTGMLQEMEDAFTMQTAENSALEDMMQFDDYMGSLGITDMLSKKDISMDRISDVMDTTVQTASSRAEYSAMVEYDVSFTLTTYGRYGISKTHKNSMANDFSEQLVEDTGYFDSVAEIESTFL